MRALGLVLIAAIVVGIGTTTGRGWGPKSAESIPQASPEETASRSMLALSDVAEEMAADAVAQEDDGAMPDPSSPGSMPSAPPASVDSRTATELHRVATLVRHHVDLLTPGLAERVRAEQSPDAATATAAPPSPTSGTSPSSAGGPADPEELAVALASSANDLLEAALNARDTDVPAILGAGIEQRLAAQQLASLPPQGTTAEQLPAVSIPDETTAWVGAAAGRLPNGSCSFATGAQSSSPEANDSSPSGPAAGSASSGTGTEATTTSEEVAAASAISGAADAAYRLAYGYQMSAAKNPGQQAKTAWTLADASDTLGHRLGALLPTDCPPVREAAYALSKDFSTSPMKSVAQAEGQLAVLLRDAAGAVPDSSRPSLILETWLAAERMLEITGTAPDLT